LREHLFSHAKFRRTPIATPLDAALDETVSQYVASLRTLDSQGLISAGTLGTALSALVDLCITGVYTNGLVDNSAEFLQRGVRCGTETVVFPYTWMCPLCVAAGRPKSECYLPSARRESKAAGARDYPQVEWLAKPGGRAIGDQGIQVVKALLRATLAASNSGARLRDGGGARGEFDLTVATDDLLAFIEVKAKPLIAYPLVIKTAAALSEPTTRHDWTDVSMSKVEELSLFLGATQTSLALSVPSKKTISTWPLTDLARAVSNPATVANIVANWAQHAEAYTQWNNEPDRLRWHRFGCGNYRCTEDGIRVEKRVANTKELPGLDRTDDIKKGAAQVLKYSRLKFQCKRHALRAVLLGNTHALTHHDDYVSPLLHLKVIEASGQADQAEWIFDAMIGLTQNHFNATDLEAVFAFENLLKEPTPGNEKDLSPGGRG